MIAPTSPPIYEKTADIFKNYRLYIKEFDDFPINTFTKGSY